MKDFTGRELHIGDEVVLIAQPSGTATNLYRGRIISFVQRGKLECANVSYFIHLRKPLTPEERIATVSSSKIMLNEKIV